MSSAQTDRTQSVLDQLDENVRALFLRLAGEDPAPVAELRLDVEEHIGLLRREAHGHKFIDLELASACAETLIHLMEGLEATPDDSEAQRLVHAAVRYFILAEDAEDDIDSVIGFDDDAEVVNAVASALGRPELAIELD